MIWNTTRASSSYGTCKAGSENEIQNLLFVLIIWNQNPWDKNDHELGNHENVSFCKKYFIFGFGCNDAYFSVNDLSRASVFYSHKVTSRSLQSKSVTYPPPPQIVVGSGPDMKKITRDMSSVQLLNFTRIWSPVPNLRMTQYCGFPLPPLPLRLSDRVNFYLQVSLIGSLIRRSHHSNRFSRFPVSPKQNKITHFEEQNNTLLMHFEHCDMKFRHIGTLKTDLSLWKQIWYGWLWPIS